MAAAVGGSREERQTLGRWAIRESRDEYIRAAYRIVAQTQGKLLTGLWDDRMWDLRNNGTEEIREFLVGKAGWTAEQAADYVREAFEMPVAWRAEAPSKAAEDTGTVRLTERLDVPAPVEEAREVRSVVRETFVPKEVDLGSEDDVDVQARFFISINPRSKHRKLHIWGRCGTKPGENFAAYEAHESLKGVEYHSTCGHCWKGKKREEEDSAGSSSSSGDSNLD